MNQPTKLQNSKIAQWKEILLKDLPEEPKTTTLSLMREAVKDATEYEHLYPCLKRYFKKLILQNGESFLDQKFGGDHNATQNLIRALELEKVIIEEDEAERIEVSTMQQQLAENIAEYSQIRNLSNKITSARTYIDFGLSEMKDEAYKKLLASFEEYNARLTIRHDHYRARRQSLKEILSFWRLPITIMVAIPGLDLELTPSEYRTLKQSISDTKSQLTNRSRRLQKEPQLKTNNTTCVNCHKKASYQCSKCHFTKYCSKACQIEYHHLHKADCKARRRALKTNRQFDQQGDLLSLLGDELNPAAIRKYLKERIQSIFNISVLEAVNIAATLTATITSLASMAVSDKLSTTLLSTTSMVASLVSLVCQLISLSSHEAKDVEEQIPVIEEIMTKTVEKAIAETKTPEPETFDEVEVEIGSISDRPTSPPPPPPQKKDQPSKPSNAYLVAHEENDYEEDELFDEEEEHQEEHLCQCAQRLYDAEKLDFGLAHNVLNQMFEDGEIGFGHTDGKGNPCKRKTHTKTRHGAYPNCLYVYCEHGSADLTDALSDWVDCINDPRSKTFTLPCTQMDEESIANLEAFLGKKFAGFKEPVASTSKQADKDTLESIISIVLTGIASAVLAVTTGAILGLKVSGNSITKVIDFLWSCYTKGKPMMENINSWIKTHLFNIKSDKEILNDTFLEYSEKLNEYLSKPTMDVYGDFKITSETAKLCKDANSFIVQSGQKNSVLANNLLRTVEKCLKRISQIQELYKAALPRVTPVSAIVYGPPGIGKTQALTYVANSLATRLFPENPSVYSLNSSKYFLPYAGQRVGRGEELGNTADLKEDIIVSHYNNMVSSGAHNLEGAFEKTQPNQMEIMLFDTNSSFEDLQKRLPLTAEARRGFFDRSRLFKAVWAGDQEDLKKERNAKNFSSEYTHIEFQLWGLDREDGLQCKFVPKQVNIGGINKHQLTLKEFMAFITAERELNIKNYKECNEQAVQQVLDKLVTTTQKEGASKLHTVINISGRPGSGKSTLVDEVIPYVKNKCASLKTHIYQTHDQMERFIKQCQEDKPVLVVFDDYFVSSGQPRPNFSYNIDSQLETQYMSYYNRLPDRSLLIIISNLIPQKGKFYEMNTYRNMRLTVDLKAWNPLQPQRANLNIYSTPGLYRRTNTCGYYYVEDQSILIPPNDRCISVETFNITDATGSSYSRQDFCKKVWELFKITISSSLSTEIEEVNSPRTIPNPDIFLVLQDYENINRLFNEVTYAARLARNPSTAPNYLRVADSKMQRLINMPKPTTSPVNSDEDAINCLEQIIRHFKAYNVIVTCVAKIGNKHLCIDGEKAYIYRGEAINGSANSRLELVVDHEQLMINIFEHTEEIIGNSVMNWETRVWREEEVERRTRVELVASYTWEEYYLFFITKDQLSTRYLQMDERHRQLLQGTSANTLFAQYLYKWERFCLEQTKQESLRLRQARMMQVNAAIGQAWNNHKFLIGFVAFSALLYGAFKLLKKITTKSQTKTLMEDYQKFVICYNLGMPDMVMSTLYMTLRKYPVDVWIASYKNIIAWNNTYLKENPNANLPFGIQPILPNECPKSKEANGHSSTGNDDDLPRKKPGQKPKPKTVKDRPSYGPRNPTNLDEIRRIAEQPDSWANMESTGKQMNKMQLAYVKNHYDKEASKYHDLWWTGHLKETNTMDSNYQVCWERLEKLSNEELDILHELYGNRFKKQRSIKTFDNCTAGVNPLKSSMLEVFLEVQRLNKEAVDWADWNTHPTSSTSEAFKTIRKNLVKLEHGGNVLFGIGIYDRIIMFPRHLVDFVNITKPIKVTDSRSPGIFSSCNTYEARPIYLSETRELAFCKADSKMPAFKDIRNQFIRMDEFPMENHAEVFCRVHNNEVSFSYAEASIIQEEYDVFSDDEPISHWGTMLNLGRGEFVSYYGDCGLPYLIPARIPGGKGFISGMHIGGSANPKYAHTVFSLVFREDFDGLDECSYDSLLRQGYRSKHNLYKIQAVAPTEEPTQPTQAMVDATKADREIKKDETVKDLLEKFLTNDTQWILGTTQSEMNAAGATLCGTSQRNVAVVNSRGTAKWAKTNHSRALSSVGLPPAKAPAKVPEEYTEEEAAKLPKDIRGVPSILKMNVDMFFEELPEFVDVNDRYAEIYAKVLRKKFGQYLKLSTEEEILCGTNQYVNNFTEVSRQYGSLELNRSVGPTMQLMFNCTKKLDALTVDPRTGKVSYRDNPAGRWLSRQVQTMMTLLPNGRRPFTAFKTCVKTELLAVEKNWKARTFEAGDTLQILMERYVLGWFNAANSTVDIENPCRVGINPYVDFHAIYNHHNQLPFHFAGDYSRWDKRLHSSLYSIFGKACQIAHTTYAQGKGLNHKNCSWCKAIMPCLNSIRYSHHFTLNALYRKGRGMPSGSYSTAVINSHLNDLQTFIAWCELVPAHDANWKSFEKHTRRSFYGDDALISVSTDYKDIFNLVTMSAKLKELFGCILDTENKDGKMYYYQDDLKKCGFISRTFRKLDGYEFYVGALKTCSVESPLHWIKHSINTPRAQVEQVQHVLMEASLWGRDYYNKIANAIKMASRYAPQLKEIHVIPFHRVQSYFYFLSKGVNRTELLECLKQKTLDKESQKALADTYATVIRKEYNQFKMSHASKFVHNKDQLMYLNELDQLVPLNRQEKTENYLGLWTSTITVSTVEGEFTGTGTHGIKQEARKIAASELHYILYTRLPYWIPESVDPLRSKKIEILLLEAITAGGKAAAWESTTKPTPAADPNAVLTPEWRRKDKETECWKRQSTRKQAACASYTMDPTEGFEWTKYMTAAVKNIHPNKQPDARKIILAPNNHKVNLLNPRYAFLERFANPTSQISFSAIKTQNGNRIEIQSFNPKTMELEVNDFATNINEFIEILQMRDKDWVFTPANLAEYYKVGFIADRTPWHRPGSTVKQAGRNDGPAAGPQTPGPMNTLVSSSMVQADVESLVGNQLGGINMPSVNINLMPFKRLPIPTDVGQMYDVVGLMKTAATSAKTVVVNNTTSKGAVIFKLSGLDADISPDIAWYNKLHKYINFHYIWNIRVACPAQYSGQILYCWCPDINDPPTLAQARLNPWSVLNLSGNHSLSVELFDSRNTGSMRETTDTKTMPGYVFFLEVEIQNPYDATALAQATITIEPRLGPQHILTNPISTFSKKLAISRAPIVRGEKMSDGQKVALQIGMNLIPTYTINSKLVHYPKLAGFFQEKRLSKFTSGNTILTQICTFKAQEEVRGIGSLTWCATGTLPLDLIERIKNYHKTYNYNSGVDTMPYTAFMRKIYDNGFEHFTCVQGVEVVSYNECLPRNGMLKSNYSTNRYNNKGTTEANSMPPNFVDNPTMYHEVPTYLLRDENGLQFCYHFTGANYDGFIFILANPDLVGELAPRFIGGDTKQLFALQSATSNQPAGALHVPCFECAVTPKETFGFKSLYPANAWIPDFIWDEKKYTNMATVSWLHNNAYAGLYNKPYLREQDEDGVENPDCFIVVGSTLGSTSDRSPRYANVSLTSRIAASKGGAIPTDADSVFIDFFDRLRNISLESGTNEFSFDIVYRGQLLIHARFNGESLFCNPTSYNKQFANLVLNELEITNIGVQTGELQVTPNDDWNPLTDKRKVGSTQKQSAAALGMAAMGGGQNAMQMAMNYFQTQAQWQHDKEMAGLQHQYQMQQIAEQGRFSTYANQLGFTQGYNNNIVALANAYGLNARQEAAMIHDRQMLANNTASDLIATGLGSNAAFVAGRAGNLTSLGGTGIVQIDNSYLDQAKNEIGSKYDEIMSKDPTLEQNKTQPPKIMDALAGKPSESTEQQHQSKPNLGATPESDAHFAQLDTVNSHTRDSPSELKAESDSNFEYVETMNKRLPINPDVLYNDTPQPKLDAPPASVPRNVASGGNARARPHAIGNMTMTK
ncbi:MAG: RNA-dependent RNA polymerase [Sanya ochthera mantis Solinvi-like virus 1]|nr:MAG: RNA-dependent RNA polymerase [Sanya ochthera mantis Solinvi-like virus 1]